MIQLLLKIILGVSLSFYFFPIGFTFLPSSINTKMIMAVLGGMFLVFNWIRNEKMSIYRGLLGTIGIASLFSLICYYAADYNNTLDNSYATYIVTMFVWLGGAYAVCEMFRIVYGNVNLSLLTIYLTAVCVVQCLMAIIIDRNPIVQNFVDSIVEQGQTFNKEIERLYGIGASLDSAGVRFATVLILISTIVGIDLKVKQNRALLSFLLMSFFLIGVLGNMISRTTSVGLIMGLAFLIWKTGFLQFVVRSEYFKFHIIFGTILIIAIGTSVYLYNSDENFQEDMRFAFEGFFNLVEKGKFQTSSTDKLNNEMWVWPQDLKTWIIGSGYFGFFTFSTDVGYCRFILYCGLIGFSVFAFFFIYNAIDFAIVFKEYWELSVMLLVLTFVIWLKVSTDIFFIYALFYCLDRPQKVREEKLNVIPA